MMNYDRWEGSDDNSRFLAALLHGVRNDALRETNEHSFTYNSPLFAYKATWRGKQVYTLYGG
jgi:hypothetical protein